jgi:hypothetical protein
MKTVTARNLVGPTSLQPGLPEFYVGSVPPDWTYRDMSSAFGGVVVAVAVGAPPEVMTCVCGVSVCPQRRSARKT